MRHLLSKCFVVFVGVLIGLLAASCCQKPDPILESGDYAWLKPIGADLDPVSAGLDQYGTISMSTPLLTEPDATFALNLNRTGLQYYTDARSDINGAAADSSQQSSVNSSGTQIQLDVQKLVQEAASAASGGVTGLLSAATPTTLPAIAVNVLPTTQPASSALSSDKFTAAMGLLKGPAPVLENRAAIITAAGDSATQNMLNFLVSPDLAKKYSDKKVLLGVSMVSVRPGSKTSTAYNAAVAQTFIYQFQPVRAETRRKLVKDVKLRQAIEDVAIDLNTFVRLQSQPNSPLVAAVSPMTETQTLDLQSSIRKQHEQASKIAAALSGFGAGVQAQTFNDWLNRNESDVSTVSGMNVVAAFGHGANICGFSVTPRLRALADPSNQNGQNNAAMVLDPISFPALVLVGVDMDDIRIIAVRDVSSNEAAHCLPAGSSALTAADDDEKTTQETRSKEYYFFEPVLKVYQSTHWTPLHLPGGGDESSGQPLTETEKLAWAAHMDQAKNQVQECERALQSKGGPGKFAPVIDYLKQEIDAIGSQAIHAEDWQFIPQTLLFEASGEAKPFAIPQISQMASSGDIQTNATKPTTQPVLLMGTGLDSLDLTSGTAVVPQAGDPTSLPSVSVANAQLIGKGAKAGSAQAITFVVSATGGKGHVPVVFQFSYNDDTGKVFFLLTPAIDVHAPDPAAPKSVTLTRTHDLKGSTQTDTVTFPSDAPAAALQSFVSCPTTRPAAGGGAEVDVNVHAHDRAK